MAISEYAPGAEVVAGGRIWVSAGIVRYPKDFMPEQFARTCRACQHVDIRMFKDDVPDRCSQCDDPDAEVTKFIEPKAFMTAYADRAGRDPASSRLRQRSADEARLVTQVPPEARQETDVAGVTTFYAPALPTAGDPRPRGQLFVLNKGPNGAGYFRCGRCEYSEAAPVAARLGRPVPTSHNNPRTGERCREENLSWPVSLGHVFETDVRTIAFVANIPPSPDADPDAAQSYRQRFLRTLSEALRISAARILNADSRDISATIQTDAGRPTVILFDAVAGGAGYSRRLCSGGRHSARALISRAIQLLDCDAQCAGACRHCLSDYRNQAFWEELDRGPVLAWLRESLHGPALPAGVPNGATPWRDASLAGLGERLRGSTRIMVPTRTLTGAGELDTATSTARFLRDVSEQISDRQINLVTATRLPLSLADLGTNDLEAMEILAGLEVAGRLAVHRLQRDEFTEEMPRIVAAGSDGLLAVWSNDPDAPLLAGLLPGSLFIANALEAEVAERIIAKLHCAIHVPGALSTILANTRTWDFAPNQARAFGEIFAQARDATGSFHIRDPFVLSGDRNRRRLVAFLKELEKQRVSIDHLIIAWREGDAYKADYEHPQVQEQEFEALLDAAKLHGFTIQYDPQPHRSRAHFHDRQIRGKLDHGDGTKTSLLWDVSSGIDNLMDSSKEAKVYLRTV
jgi:hypothetical protein